MNQMDFASKVTQNYHENLVNILSAIQQAGGGVDVASTDMTLHDFLMLCSTNSITINAKHERKEYE